MNNQPARADRYLAALVAYGDRLAGPATLEEIIDAALVGLEELCGYRHSLLLVHQPELGRLITVAGHGYEVGGAGSEVQLGEGVIGMVGERQTTMRIGNLQRMLSYVRSARGPTLDSRGHDDIRLPGLTDARSQLAAPMIARGVLVGVLAVESSDALAYDEFDEQTLTIAAHLVAAAVEREHLAVADAEWPAPASISDSTTPTPTAPPTPGKDAIVLRHYAVDGSTFLDDKYVIKGVAGRLLWKLVADHASTGRVSFTNREAKLDPTLELPEYRDNFESRLILLKRRLDEQGLPLRIRSTGRGRFDLEVSSPLALEHVSTS